MAQINLLKQKHGPANFAEALPSILVKLLIVLTVAAAIYYGWLFVNVKKIGSEVRAVQESITETKGKITSVQGSEEVVVRQSQLKELDKLIDNHIYWSQIFPVLASSTLRTAGYSSLRAQTDGNISLSAAVPNLIELDKYLQVFNLPQFYENFSDVRIGSIERNREAQSSSVKFQVMMKYNPVILKYKDAKAALK
jgi:hypothetical protein